MQVFPHARLPDHEEEQPHDTHHAAGGPGHAPQGLCEIRSVASKSPTPDAGPMTDLLTTMAAFGKEKSESLEGTVWQSKS